MSTDEIDDLHTVFYVGDRRALAAARCPRCGGRLAWSPSIRPEARLYRGAQKHPMGLTVYCAGRCDHMLGHWDGIAPDWAVEVSDWDAFNEELRADSAA